VRVAVLIKQVPKFEAMELGPDGRLRREGLELEMNPYCRRAVSQGVELVRATGGTCTVLTLGPPAAEDALREAVAWGADQGVLITDPAFAGSDTLATARALAAALRHTGPFDLVLAGRNSVDADTGQVGPELAELLDLPFVAGVRELALGEGAVTVRCEEDDGYSDRVVTLPAVLSCAERLIEPAKVEPDGRAAVPADRIRVLTAAVLGPGPWGQPGSPTAVGDIKVFEIDRARQVLDGAVADQVARAVELLHARGALTPDRSAVSFGPMATETDGRTDGGPAVAVLVEPGRANVTRELLGAGARLAAAVVGRVVAIAAVPEEHEALSSWGADALVTIDGALVEEDIAAAVAGWCADHTPWAVLAPGTVWGREVASRTAARLGAGLTGDAVELEVGPDGRLIAWKPAFGGRLVAAITASSPVQLATVRAGVLHPPLPRAPQRLDGSGVAVAARGRVEVRSRQRDDDLDDLASATRVVGVGTGVPPDEYGALEPLLEVLGAELAATRKVTDKGWLPRARQVGITGRSIKPQLYVSIGASGKFNHVIGFRSAGTVLAVNPDPGALIFDVADIGIVGDWREAVPLLTTALGRALSS
jgi:electron transfer flavoprotein alpha subunit